MPQLNFVHNNYPQEQCESINSTRTESGPGFSSHAPYAKSEFLGVDLVMCTAANKSLLSTVVSGTLAAISSNLHNSRHLTLSYYDTPCATNCRQLLYIYICFFWLAMAEIESWAKQESD